MKKNLYYIEITDTFGGEANYSWVTRHILRAKSPRGAINRLSRLSGIYWHSVGCERYDSQSGATCCFVRDYEAEYHDNYRLDTDERGAE